MADPELVGPVRWKLRAALCLLLGLMGCGSQPVVELSGTRVVEVRPSGLSYQAVAVSPGRGLLAAERFDHDRRLSHVVVASLTDDAPAAPAAVAQGRAPVWLSDTRLLFLSGDAAGNADLWSVSVDGLDVRPLTRTAAAESSVSSAPDGRRILFARATVLRDRDGLLSGYADQQVVLAEMDERGLAERAVVARADRQRGAPSNPQWGPDGQVFAYTRQDPARRPGVNDLYVMNADGTADRLLAEDAVLLAWVPDGTAVFYGRRASVDVQGEVRRIGIDGRGDRLVLADTHVPAAQTTPRQWDPAQQRLALAAQPIVGSYDERGFGSTAGIVLLDAGGTVVADLREVQRKDELEGGVHWDRLGRLVFARHAHANWYFDDAVAGGLFLRDPTSSIEVRLLPDDLRYREPVPVR